MNEKELLIEEIQHYKNVVDEYLSLHREHENFHTHPLKQMSVMKRIGIWFVGSLLIDLWFNPTMSLILCLGLFFVLFIYPTMHIKKKIRENRDKIDHIQVHMKELERSVNPTYIPQTYINKYALTKIESYLINKRADNLKEALNLFETEKRHDEQMQEINILQKMQEITYKKADEAATLSWIGLFKR